ncbi:MAG: hypothetical protein H7234_06700 [Herminiimonas sp.]|nr:hypothetical protein [Herminiimonas sp.]
MDAIARIDDEVIGVNEFFRILKLTGHFASLVEQMCATARATCCSKAWTKRAEVDRRA